MKQERARQRPLPDPRQAGRTAVGVAVLLLSAANVCAQTVTVVPRLSVTETFTNNANLSSTAAQSEQITEISPGVRVNVEGARLKAYFDYALNHVYYTQGTSASENQNALSTFGTFEALENRAFIDFSGNITQQAISPFGLLSNSNSSINSNRTEVSNYSISPYVRGQLGSLADYQARFRHAVNSSDTNADTTNTDASVHLGNASAFGSLGWSADVSRQQVDYSAGRNTEADNLSLGLTYTVSPQVNVSVNAGRESSNYTSLDKKSYDTGSVGLNWRPSERTSLSVITGRRSFGNTHNLSFEHRSARTVWRFSDTQDITTTPDQRGVGSIGNAYDLFYAQFADLVPDPIARAQLVTAYLQTYGINPRASVISEFLLSAVARQRRQDLSFALLGIRDTVTFLLTRTKTNRLDTLSSSFDSLSDANVVTQQGFSVNYSHRLTPDYSLGALLSRQLTEGTTDEQESTLTSFSVNLSAKVGRRTSATLSLHRNVSDGLANSYNETAVSANLTVQF